MSLALWISHSEEWLANEKVNFNGETREIHVNDGVTELDIRDDVYSAWVRWVERNDNERYYFAMRFTGLDPIPGGQTGDTYFLINNWKLIYDPRIVAITGILYSDDYATPYFFTDGSPVYPATVSALGIKSNVTVDYNQLAAAVAQQFAEPSMTTAGIASATATAIGTVDVDATEIADEVESRFTFGDDGRVAADIKGSVSDTEIKATVAASIPAFPAPSTIWDAAPRHLKKAVKQKDYSDAIRSLSNKLDSLYNAVNSAQRDDIPSVDLDPILEAIGASRAPESAEILDRIAGLSIPDNTQDIASIRAQVETLQTEIESITDSIIEVRDEITRIPPPDLSAIATKSELSAVRSLVGKLSNYDDVQVKQMLEAIITNTEALPDDIERVSRKADLMLDNQMKLF